MPTDTDLKKKKTKMAKTAVEVVPPQDPNESSITTEKLQKNDNKAVSKQMQKDTNGEQKKESKRIEVEDDVETKDETSDVSASKSKKRWVS